MYKLSLTTKITFCLSIVMFIVGMIDNHQIMMATAVIVTNILAVSVEIQEAIHKEK